MRPNRLSVAPAFTCPACPVYPEPAAAGRGDIVAATRDLSAACPRGSELQLRHLRPGNTATPGCGHRNRKPQGKFDFVAANPPWINWESLPAQHFRHDTRCAEYFHKVLLLEAVGPLNFRVGDKPPTMRRNRGKEC